LTSLCWLAVVGLAGFHGSGNSELMQGLFGVFGRRTAGGVALDGRPFRPSAPRQAIRQGVALLTNDRKGTGLVLDLSIDWNITLAALRRFSPWGWLRPRQEEQAAAAQRDALGIRCAGLRQPVGWLSWWQPAESGAGQVA
jgi:ABC-type sugar transport system ATPase subunit